MSPIDLLIAVHRTAADLGAGRITAPAVLLAIACAVALAFWLATRGPTGRDI